MGERIAIESLEPFTKAKCEEHRRIATSIGLHTLVTEGARTWGEQMERYAIGRARTSRGWIVTSRRDVVTDALPDHAPHCRAAAYDLWLLFGHAGEGHLRLATMDPKDGWSSAEIEQQITLWGALVRIGTELGMECGAHWPKLKDWPHFERPDWRDLPAPEST
jgi:hypothetical protein